jgi:hypothetical protein
MALGIGQAAGDLVEKEQFGIGGERASELEPFALQEAERAGGLIGAAR